MQGGADSELIEMIDADPSVFGSSPPRVTSPRPVRGRPKWIVPVAVALVGILASVATLAVWRPWDSQFRIRLSFPSAPLSEPTLTERLVFDNAPGALSASSIGGADDGSAVEAGHFFAAPDATLNLGQGGTGTWAALIGTDAGASADLGAGQGGTELTVQGVPGVLTPSLGDHTLRLSFGPLDGHVYSVVTSEMSTADTLALAEVVSIRERVPVIADGSVLRGLKPLCSIADLNAAYGMVLLAANPAHYPQPQIATTQYDPATDRITLTSQWAPESGLAPLQFVLGGEIDATVHGEPALTFVTDDSEALLAFGVKLGSVIAWIEGGRLIMVTGQLPVDELVQLAESVRPATDDEWDEISRVAA